MSFLMSASIVWAAGAQPDKIIAPGMRLNTPIPGLTLDPVVEVDGLVRVNFLAQYIGAAYQYLVGISVIAASIMIVYGGFRYVLGATVPEIAEGKKVIQDALIGLVLMLGAYTILQTLNSSLVTLKTLELPGVKSESFYLDANGTTGSPDGPNAGAAGMSGGTPPESSGSGQRASQQPPVDIPPDQLVDISTLPKYDASIGGPANLNVYCHLNRSPNTKSGETKTVDSYSASIKELVKVVYGFGLVCVDKKQCAYVQGGGTTLSNGEVRAGANPKYAYDFLVKNNMPELSVNIFRGENKDTCSQALGAADVKTLMEKPDCAEPLKYVYDLVLPKYLQDSKIFGSDCGGFVWGIYACAGQPYNQLPLQQQVKGKPPTIYYDSKAIELFKDYPAMIVAAHLDEDIEAIAAKKGGVKFGDVIYVTDGVGVKNHFLLWTGGRPELPFSIIDMGGGQGATIPGISTISGVREYPSGLSLAEYVRKLTDPGGTTKYNPTKGAIFIWRPYTERGQGGG